MLLKHASFSGRHLVVVDVYYLLASFGVKSQMPSGVLRVERLVRKFRKSKWLTLFIQQRKLNEPRSRRKGCQTFERRWQKVWPNGTPLFNRGMLSEPKCAGGRRKQISMTGNFRSGKPLGLVREAVNKIKIQLAVWEVVYTSNY